MLRALTVWQPNASLLCMPDLKGVENRKKRTHYRGELAIHAGLKVDEEAMAGLYGLVMRLRNADGPLSSLFKPGVRVPEPGRTTIALADIIDMWKRLPAPTAKPFHLDLPLEAVVGVIDLVDCVTESGSPYFTGPFGWVRATPRLLPTPVPCKGMQGIWFLPDEVEAAVRGQLEGRG